MSETVARREAVEDMDGHHQRACMFEYLQALMLVVNEGVFPPLCFPVFVANLSLAVMILPCRIIASWASSSPVIS